MNKLSLGALVFFISMYLGAFVLGSLGDDHWAIIPVYVTTCIGCCVGIGLCIGWIEDRQYMR